MNAMRKRLTAFVLMLVVVLSLASHAFAVTDGEMGYMPGTDEIIYRYESNSDGTFTVHLESETPGTAMPNYRTSSGDASLELYTSIPYNGSSGTSTNDDVFTKVVIDENITAVGSFTMTNMNHLSDVYVMAPNAVMSSQAIYGYNSYIEGGLTIHAYTTATVKYAFNGETEPNKTSVTISYLEAENFTEAYGPLADVAIGDADAYVDSIDSACAELTAMPDAAKDQLNAELIAHIESLKDATKHGKMPDTWNDTTTATYRYSPNGDGTYTVYIADEGGDGIIPTYGTNKTTETNFDTYAMLPYNESKSIGVTKIVFEDSITHIGRYTVANMKDLTDIYIMGENVTMDTNGFYGYSGFGARAKELTIHAYSGVTVNNGISSNEVTTTYSYLEAENFIEKYEALWSMEWDAAKDSQADILAAVTEYDAFGDIIQEQLAEEYTILIDLQYALLGGKMADTTATTTTATWHYEKNNDGVNTYTVVIEDPSGNGKLPDYDTGDGYKYSANSFNKAAELKSVTQIRFEDSITYIGKYAICNPPNLTKVYIMNPEVKMHDNALYGYHTTSDFSHNTTEHTIYGYSTAELKEDFRPADITVNWVFFDVEAFKTDYADVLAMNAEDAIANAERIAEAAAALGEIGTENTVRQNSNGTASNVAEAASQLADEIAKLDELAAALGVLEGECGENLAYSVQVNSETNYTLKITGTGAMNDYSSADAPWETLADEIKTIVIEEGVTTLSAGAFDDLTALERVDMAESVSEIGEGAFPATEFTVDGWMNHPAGNYAKANDNVTLVLKELRILSIGNSHTDDYTQWFASCIIPDLEAHMGTEIVHERVTRGGRQIALNTNGGGAYGTHTQGITDPTHEKYEEYQAALAKTWDIVIFQDYRESVLVGMEFAVELQNFVGLLRDRAPGAQLVWFADWVENSFNSTAKYYNNSIAVMQAASGWTENAPDLIIPMSTVIKNARTTYLGTTMNPDGVHASYPNNNVASGDRPNTKMPILERDNAHLSYELGRYLAGAAVMSYIVEEYGEYLSLDDGFDYYESLVTKPDYSWLGEFTDEIWTIIEEVTEASKVSPYSVTESDYAEDPFDAMYETVISVLDKALPYSKTETSLNQHLKSEAVINEINTKTGLNIDADDIEITVDEGEYTVRVDCHYGYSYPANAALTGEVTALFGDLDGNGEVTDRDAAKLVRALAGWPGYEEYLDNDAADINGDGNITDADAMILARYLACWPGYDEYFN